MPTRHNAWPKEHDSILREMAEAGYTTLAVAARLVRSKNSIIGRAHRLKIKWKNDGPLHRRPAEIKTPVEIKPNIIKPKKAILSLQGGAKKQIFFEDRSPIVLKTKADGISLLSASQMNCKWPIDARGIDGMPRCCGEKTNGTSYCFHHRQRSYMASHYRLRDGTSV